MSVSNVMFSSESDVWATPQAFFNHYNEEFGFTLDACALPDNAKCSKYYTPEQNALAQDWTGIVWMNPPYGNPEHPCKPKCKKKKCEKRGYHIQEYIPGITDWMEKAYSECLKGATVVCLVPARTDTQWWFSYALRAAEIRFVEGRLNFNDGGTAPFPSAVIVFKPGHKSAAPKVIWQTKEFRRIA